MMEWISRGSTSCARAALSTIAFRSEPLALIGGAILVITGLEETTTLRTNFPVRGSARTTCVRWTTGGGAVVAGFTSAARLGEAASMARAIKKQIYTFLLDRKSVV